MSTGLAYSVDMSTATGTYSPQQITAIGGRDWKGRRTYLNDVAALIGLDVDYYLSGNVRSAALDGRPLSNARAGELLNVKVYLDHATGTLVIQVPERSRTLPTDKIIARIHASVARLVGAL